MDGKFRRPALCKRAIMAVQSAWSLKAMDERGRVFYRWGEHAKSDTVKRLIKKHIDVLDVPHKDFEYSAKKFHVASKMFGRLSGRLKTKPFGGCGCGIARHNQLKALMMEAHVLSKAGKVKESEEVDLKTVDMTKELGIDSTNVYEVMVQKKQEVGVSSVLAMDRLQENLRNR